MAGSKPTHFAGGVSAAAVSTPLYLMGFIDPALYHTWFSDFDEWDAGQWVVTETTTTGTEAIADEDGGIVQFVTPVMDDCLLSAQWCGQNSADVAETFTFTSTKKMFLRTRLKVSDASNCDMVVGLAITDTSPLDAADGIFFFMADGSTDVSVKLVNSGASTTTTVIGTMVSDTYAILGIAYIPGFGFNFYFNDALVASGVAVTNAPSTEIAVTVAMQSGAAAATTLSVDHLLVAKER